MTTVRQLHNEAMVLAEEAKLAQDAGRLDEAQKLAAQAFALEFRAVGLVPKAASAEPTRSILCLSAGSLAMQARMFLDAERILNEGLSGHPPDRTRQDLYEVLDQVLSERRQENLAAEDRPTRLNLRLLGGAVGYGRAPSREVTSRISAAESILERRSLIEQDQPWQPSGPVPKELRTFDTYVHAFALGSLEIELELAPRYMTQLRLEGEPPSAIDVVSSVLSGLQSLQDNNMKQLELIYPDPAYLKHFVTRARDLAPDGDVIRSVEIQGANRSLEFTRNQASISVPRSSERLMEAATSSATVMSGRLVAGDISSSGKNRDTVKLEFPDGNHELYKVTEGLEDLVRSYFGQFVTLDLERPTRGRAAVVDVKPYKETEVQET
jgi:hypothetical protein